MRRFISIIAALLLAAVIVPGVPTKADAQGAALSGKVVETMDSGGYTYAQIEKGGKKTWVAVPKSKITKGQNITFEPGMEMTNFESKTMKRTFKSIVFSQGIAK